MGEERRGRRDLGRILGRKLTSVRDLDISTPMELQSSRSFDSENLVSKVTNNNSDLLPSSALANRSRRRILEKKQSLDWEDELEEAIEVLDTPLLTRRRILRPTEFAQEGLQSIVNSVELEDRSRLPLDRRRYGSSRQLRPLRQGGIGGVAYDDIYLAIGVAATALFIIETLYKTYQLYNSAGRSLEETSIDLIEGWPGWPS